MNNENENTYLNEEDGLHYCSHCHTPVEKDMSLKIPHIKNIPSLMGRTKFPIMCQCREAEVNARNARSEENRHRQTVERIIRNGIYDKKILDWNFLNDDGSNLSMHIAKKYAHNFISNFWTKRQNLDKLQNFGNSGNYGGSVGSEDSGNSTGAENSTVGSEDSGNSTGAENSAVGSEDSGNSTGAENSAVGSENSVADFGKKEYGLMLWGDVGVGKSYMAGCIANELIKAEISVCVTNFPIMVSMLQDITVNKNEFIENLNKNQLLIIDDFGMERNTSFAMEQLYRIIDSRYVSGKPLIITTNLTPDQLEDTGVDMDRRRIYDRVLEMCVPIKVTSGVVSRRKGVYLRNIAQAREELLKD